MIPLQSYYYTPTSHFDLYIKDMEKASDRWIHGISSFYMHIYKICCNGNVPMITDKTPTQLNIQDNNIILPLETRNNYWRHSDGQIHVHIVRLLFNQRIAGTTAVAICHGDDVTVRLVRLRP